TGQTTIRKGGSSRGAHTIDDASRRELDGSRNRRALRRGEAPGIETEIGECHDLVSGQICGLFDSRMALEVARRSNHDAPDIAAKPDRDERRILQFADAQRNVDAFLDQVDGPVEQK